MTRQDLKVKYQGYQDQGHLILCVTLSTFIKSAAYAHSDRTRQMFDHHFIGRVQRCLTYKAKTKLDYDWLMEESPEGYWHYHGLMAVTSIYAHHLWSNNTLNRRLAASLRTFKHPGLHRSFRINSFLIEPVVSVDAWCQYITKKAIESTFKEVA